MDKILVELGLTGWFAPGVVASVCLLVAPVPLAVVMIAKMLRARARR